MTNILETLFAKRRLPTDRLAVEMREDIYPYLLARGFETRRPNRKRKGMFPTFYWRDRGDDALDALYFQWDMYGLPRFIISFEIFRGAENIGKVKDGWPSEDLREIGGRVAARKGLLNREVWFGLSGAMALMPKVLQRWRIKRTIRTALKRIDEVDGFMKGEAPFPPSGYNWNLPLQELSKRDQNRCLTKAERDRYCTAGRRSTSSQASNESDRMSKTLEQLENDDRREPEPGCTAKPD